MRFRDRAHAGQLLAAELEEYSGRDDVAVLGLPRGGVPGGGAPPLELAGRTAILVDDGLATGASMRAAALAASAGLPREVIVAVPVAAESTARDLSREVDRVVCVLTPPRFLAVGAWYEDFAPVSDDEVRRLLESASAS